MTQTIGVAGPPQPVWVTPTYRCAGCGAVLFSSGTKFESGSGWPSFYKPEDEENIERRTDSSYGMVRTEGRGGR